VRTGGGDERLYSQVMVSTSPQYIPQLNAQFAAQQ
jgi:hypothetical protein